MTIKYSLNKNLNKKILLLLKMFCPTENCLLCYGRTTFIDRQNKAPDSEQQTNIKCADFVLFYYIIILEVIIYIKTNLISEQIKKMEFFGPLWRFFTFSWPVITADLNFQWKIKNFSKAITYIIITSFLLVLQSAQINEKNI